MCQSLLDCFPLNGIGRGYHETCATLSKRHPIPLNKLRLGRQIYYLCREFVCGIDVVLFDKHLKEMNQCSCFQLFGEVRLILCLR